MNYFSTFLLLIAFITLVRCSDNPATNPKKNHKPTLQESFRSDNPVQVQPPIITTTESDNQSDLNIFILKNKLYIRHKQKKVDFNTLRELKAYIKNYLTDFQESPVNLITEKGVPQEQLEAILTFLRQNEINELRFLSLNKN